MNVDLKMKAAVYDRYGGPDVITLQVVPVINPKEGEVLVKVYSSTVNRTDTGFRSAENLVSRLFSGLLRPKNRVLGCEFAGEVSAIGMGVELYKVGDRVFGYDDNFFGGHAEFKIIAESGTMALIPEGVSYTQAAALTEGSHYALGNIRAAKVSAGDIVLVYGATGAIGTAAVQLLKYFGAYVVAVVNSKNTKLASSIGADEVIDYQRQDFTHTNYHFDFVFDAAGKSSFGQCKPLLKSKGIYISTELGKCGENIWLAISTSWGRGKRVLFPIPSITREDVLFLGDLARQGMFRAVIDRAYPLSQIVEAHRYVDTGQKTGNVLISLDSNAGPA